MLTKTAPRQHSLRGLSAHGFHRVVWHEWGDPGNPRVAICVHGLTRTGRDFDVLGEALATTHRVLAVDMPGRGLSEWLPVKADYGFPTYLTTLTALIERLNQTVEKHVVTIEDPIEFLHRDKRSLVNQREVDVDTRNFAGALRASLRGFDPPGVFLSLGGAASGKAMALSTKTRSAAEVAAGWFSSNQPKKPVLISAPGLSFIGLS